VLIVSYHIIIPHKDRAGSIRIIAATTIGSTITNLIYSRISDQDLTSDSALLVGLSGATVSLFRLAELWADALEFVIEV
jgi:uncharacterized membrane protein YeaQ/YmgE (transglycosylase-associated protein family)